MRKLPVVRLFWWGRVAALVHKEWSAYFATPLAYVFLTLYLLLSGLLTFFIGGFLDRNQADLQAFFTFQPWLCLIFVPALSMRSVAEERKSGTLELLLTLPLGSAQAVLAKWLACWGFCMLALLLTMPFWVTVNLLGHPDNGVVAVSYAAHALLMGAFAAIGVFASCLSRQQVTAFIIGVVSCFFFILSGTPLVQKLLAPWAPLAVSDTIAAFSVLGHVDGISRGLVAVKSVCFLVLLMVTFYISAVAALQRRFMLLPISGLVLLGGNILLRLLFPTAAWDVTQEKLYALSDGSKRVLAKLEEPVTLRFYYSSALGQSAPTYATYARRIEELLRTYVDVSRGKLRLLLIDPEPFSENEDAALAQGLQGIRLNAGGDKAYFGLVASNSTDGREAIGFFQPEREAFLEYDITRMIQNLSHPARPRIAVLSALSIDGDPMALFTTGRSDKPWAVLSHLRQLFEVTVLPPESTTIPEDTNLLILVQPEELPLKALYAVDQFAVGGGRLLAFIDPFPELRRVRTQMILNKESEETLAKLLATWGLAMDTSMIVADSRYARKVSIRVDDRDIDVPHLGWLGLDEGALDKNDRITALLGSLTLASAGAFSFLPNAAVTREVLVRSSVDAALMPMRYLRPAPDLLGLLKDFKTNGSPLTLAVRVSGVVKSAFDEPPSGALNHQGQGTKAFHSVLVADTDMLRDELWLQTGSFMGSDVAIPTSGNGAFILNAAENLLGTDDLISLRSRGTSQRPFTVLENKARIAEQQFRAIEQHLRSELQEAESHLGELIKSDDTTASLITKDQEIAINDYQIKIIALRGELRQVQRSLRRDIERLQLQIVVTNLIIAPALVILIAIVGGWRRRHSLRRGSARLEEQ
ncbi:MAG: Gldg family protein [Holosporales bacterium]|jgi:ABC-type uncharacterized transport system involved in gliding motility auxiliary subunit/ABC-type transport system involved in multi-copper enzyme maturation permease subunit